MEMFSFIAIVLVVQTVALHGEVLNSDGSYDDSTTSPTAASKTTPSFGDIVANATNLQAETLLKVIQPPPLLSLTKTITVEDVSTGAPTTTGYNTKDDNTSVEILSGTNDGMTKTEETTQSSSPATNDFSTSTLHVSSITSISEDNTTLVLLEKASTQIPKHKLEFNSEHPQDSNPIPFLPNLSFLETHVAHDDSINETSTTTVTNEATRIPKRIQGIRDRPARPDPGYSYHREVERPYRPDTPIHEYPYYRPTPEDRTSIIKTTPDDRTSVIRTTPEDRTSFFKPTYEERTSIVRQDPTRFFTPYRPSFPYVAQGSFGRPYRPDSVRPESIRPSTSVDEISRADEYTRLSESFLKEQKPSIKPFSVGTVISAKNMTRVEYLKADCFDNYMKVTIRFNGTFYGLIYSTGYAQDTSCSYVNGSGQNNYEFMIRLNRCGTLGQQEDNGARKRKERSQYLVNTVTVQYNAVIEEDIDEHFRVTCEYGYDFWRTVTFPVLSVESASMHQLRTGSPVVFTLPPPQCTMELRIGYGANAPRIKGPVNVGDPITLVIRMKSESTGFDILVSNCFAHNGAQKRLQLIDSHGCVVEDKLMSEFQGEDNSQEITLSSHLKAFRFTGSPALYLECDVHMCHGSCPAQRCYWRIKRSAEEQEQGVLSESVSLFQALEVRHIDEPQPKSQDDMICMGNGGFTALTTCVLFFLIISLCASFYVCVRRGKLEDNEVNEFDGHMQLK